MSEIYIDLHERAPITDEARLVAREIIEEVKHGLDNDVPEPILGYIGSEQALRRLRQIDRDHQERYGADGSICFGTTRKPHEYMYQAIRRGYDPTPGQLKAAEEEGADFLWDEVAHGTEHADIFEVFGQRDGPHVGAYVVAEDVLEDALGVLFMRGQEYREWGWGFPWWSDTITVADDGAEAMK